MLKKILLSLLALITLLIFASLAYLLWASNGAPASQQALDALQGSDSIVVSEDPWITFEPTGVAADTGIIFYPGGQADPRSYAPPLRALAAQGNLVVLVPMPFNLAVFAIDSASDVIAAHPGIKHWIIAGHSLGGVMAAQYVANNPGLVDGLGLWAAYPAGSADLSTSDIAVAVIYGSEDRMATVEEVEAATGLLPEQTSYLLIKGADHYQFGYFDDVPVNASIKREQQQQALLQAMRTLIVQVQAGD